jgi:aromatic ring-opening dioxygenase LigB subunit
MTLIGCFATPHPPIIVPEVGGGRLAEADATVRAMRAVRERAAVLDPDAVVLMSPHSALARSQMGVSLASSYHGSLAYFQAPWVRVPRPPRPGLTATRSISTTGPWSRCGIWWAG